MDVGGTRDVRMLVTCGLEGCGGIAECTCWDDLDSVEEGLSMDGLGHDTDVHRDEDQKST